MSCLGLCAASASITGGTTFWYADPVTWFTPDLSSPDSIISLTYAYTASAARFTDFAGEVLVIHENSILCLGDGCGVNEMPPSPPSAISAFSEPPLSATLNCP